MSRCIPRNSDYPVSRDDFSDPNCGAVSGGVQTRPSVPTYTFQASNPVVNGFVGGNIWTDEDYTPHLNDEDGGAIEIDNA